MARAARSGQATVATAGTEVVLGNGAVNGFIVITAIAANAGVVYVGNNGSNAVASTTGYTLSAGSSTPSIYVGDLNEIWVDSAENDEVVNWIVQVFDVKP